MKAVLPLGLALLLVLVLAVAIAPARAADADAEGGRGQLQTKTKPPKKPAAHAVNSHFPGMDFVDCANYDSGDGKRVGDPNKPGYYQNKCPGVQNALRDTTCEGQTSGHPTKNEAAKKAALTRWKQLEPQKSEYKTFRETKCKMQVFDAAAGKMVDKKTKNGGQVYKNVIAAHQDDNPNHNCASNIKWECDGEDGGNENERENDRKAEMGKPCQAKDASGKPATGAVCMPDPESCAKSGSVATKGTKSGQCWGTKNGGVCCLITAGNTISPRGDDPDKKKPKGTEPTVGDRSIWIAYRAALAADANWQARNPGCEGTAWLSNICKPKGAAPTTTPTAPNPVPMAAALIDAGAVADVDADEEADMEAAKPHSIAEEQNEMKRVDDLLAKLDRTEKHCKEVKGKMANGKCDKDQKDKQKGKQKDCKGGKTKDGKSCKEKGKGKGKDPKAKGAKDKSKGTGKGQEKKTGVTGGKTGRDRRGKGLGKGKGKSKGGKGKGKGKGRGRGAKQKQQKQQKPQKPKQKGAKKGNGKCDPKTKKDRRGKKCRP